MVYIYTDTTVSNHTAYCTVFIITDSNYLGCETFVHKGVKGSVLGELLAIRDGLKMYRESNYDDSVIMVLTDCNDAIMHIEKKTKLKRFKPVVSEIENLSESMHIAYKKIKGHLMSHNPNKIVDMMSRSIKTIMEVT